MVMKRDVAFLKREKPEGRNTESSHFEGLIFFLMHVGFFPDFWGLKKKKKRESHK